ncbi:hypothetical protein EZS27_036072 [termite gut metagenome]|uniref:Uncharacterized protein n=1 Tax=termite gut metagenome TaxID=433724 RepID=A0A5J4PWC9_9ZZZZ
MAAIMPFFLALGISLADAQVEVFYGLIATYGAQCGHIQTASHTGVALFGDACSSLVMLRLAQLDIQTGITDYLKGR